MGVLLLITWRGELEWEEPQHQHWGETVGIGLLSARPDLSVVVVDGDGNATMGLSAWNLLPIDGLHYYVLDNGSYETTGSQPTPHLSVEHPAVQRVEIEPGVVGAPLPPPPEQTRAAFLGWLAGNARQENKTYAESTNWTEKYPTG